MPDKRKHRGQHPRDAELFCEDEVPALAGAVEDLSMLLSRGYPEKASLKLVGDRFRLKARQRKAVLRASCSREAALERRQKNLAAEDLKDCPLAIDGFNLLITIESALSDGFIFEGVDGCYRDLASIHGSYKRVTETPEAIHLIGEGLKKWEAGPVLWLLDQPVSNSGRLYSMLYEISSDCGYGWEVKLHHHPDDWLIRYSGVVVTSDSHILDGAARWTNLARYLIDTFIPGSNMVRLGGD